MLLKPMNMNLKRSCSIVVLLVVTAINAANPNARADHSPRAVLSDAVVDLRTSEGIAHVKAQWRHSDTKILEIPHRDVGPDLKASGEQNHTFDFTPDARAVDFDDGKWEIIRADSLEARRGHGRLSFNWYRINITLPEKVAAFNTKGSTAVFEIMVDD